MQAFFISVVFNPAMDQIHNGSSQLASMVPVDVIAVFLDQAHDPPLEEQLGIGVPWLASLEIYIV